MRCVVIAAAVLLAACPAGAETIQFRSSLSLVGGTVTAGSYSIGDSVVLATPTARANGTLTLIGYKAGLNIDLGATESTVIGDNAGGSRGTGMTGPENTLVGWHSGAFMTSGGFNTALGVNTMGLETTGNNLVAVGTDSMRNSTGLVGSIAVGPNALRNAAGTITSVAIGKDALYGDETGTNANAGSDIVAIGYRAVYSAARTTAAGVVAVGTRAGYSLTTGSGITLVGMEAGKANTSGLHTTAVGSHSLSAVTTGNANVALGRSTGAQITTSSDNTLIGHAAGTGLTGANNVVVGSGALTAAGTAGDNVVIGKGAGARITGSSNVVIGTNVASATLASGSNNIVIGTSGAADTAAGNTANSLWIGGGTTAVISATRTSTAAPAVSIPGNLTVGTGLFVPTKTPASATDTGTAGQIAWDSDYIYICTATNTWRRVAIAAW